MTKIEEIIAKFRKRVGIDPKFQEFTAELKVKKEPESEAKTRFDEMFAKAKIRLEAAKNAKVIK